MGLHARQVAIAAGAAGDEVDRVAGQMVQERTVRIDRAAEILMKSGQNWTHDPRTPVFCVAVLSRGITLH
jgi:hypothetical protein